MKKKSMHKKGNPLHTDVGVPSSGISGDGSSTRLPGTKGSHANKRAALDSEGSTGGKNEAQYKAIEKVSNNV